MCFNDKDGETVVWSWKRTMWSAPNSRAGPFLAVGYGWHHSQHISRFGHMRFFDWRAQSIGWTDSGSAGSGLSMLCKWWFISNNCLYALHVQRLHWLLVGRACLQHANVRDNLHSYPRWSIIASRFLTLDLWPLTLTILALDPWYSTPEALKHYNWGYLAFLCFRFKRDRASIIIQLLSESIHGLI